MCAVQNVSLPGDARGQNTTAIKTAAEIPGAVFVTPGDKGQCRFLSPRIPTNLVCYSELRTIVLTTKFRLFHAQRVSPRPLGAFQGAAHVTSPARCAEAGALAACAGQTFARIRRPRTGHAAVKRAYRALATRKSPDSQAGKPAGSGTFLSPVSRRLHPLSIIPGGVSKLRPVLSHDAHEN